MSRSSDRKRIPAAPVLQDALLEREAEAAAERVASRSTPAGQERSGPDPAPIPSAARGFYEAGLGHDFSRVRIHTGEAAAEAAEEQGAHGYTVGHDVVLGRDFAPETPAGRSLLAHELAHVVQQADGPPVLQRQSVTVVPGSSGLGLFGRPLVTPGLRGGPMMPTNLDALDAPIRTWLQAHLADMRVLSVEGIIRRVRQHVPQAADRSDGWLEGTILAWAAENNFTPGRIGAIPDQGRSIPPPPPSTSTQLADLGHRLAGVVSAATDGIGYRDATGRAVVSVSGATVGLRSREGTQVSGTLGWTGSLGLEAERGPVHFEASLDQDKWELKLSFGADTAVPDISRLERVFTEGEGALRHIVADASTFRNLGDISRIRTAVHPYIEPVSDAVEAVQGIASTPRVNVGIEASGPGYGPEQPGAQPRGVEIRATLTIRF